MNKEVNSRRLRIRLINGDDLTGYVNLDRAPGYERLSDLVTENSEKFLVLFSATIQHKDFLESMKYETMFINRDHIIYAAPEDSRT